MFDIPNGKHYLIISFFPLISKEFFNIEKVIDDDKAKLIKRKYENIFRD